jgi:glucose/arabinose dehydrogenase
MVNKNNSLKSLISINHPLARIILILFLLSGCSPLPVTPVINSGISTQTVNAFLNRNASGTAAATSSMPSAQSPEKSNTVTRIPVINSTTPQQAASGRLPLPPADQATARLIVSNGFAIRIFAQDLDDSPRFMAFGPDGSLYLTLTRAGKIVRLADKDANGLADSNYVVISQLNQPHGLAWHDGWLYVAENDRIERLHSTTGEGIFNIRELVTNNIPGGSGHFTRTIHFGPDGKMYVSAGSSCNVCAESDPRRAAILRFNPDGTIPSDNPFAGDSDFRKRPVWAGGLRNSVDFLWTPTGQMWANMNGRDNMMDANGQPDNLPPEVIVFPIQGGRSYGWPYCYTPVLGFNSLLAPQMLDNQSGLSLPAGFDCNQTGTALFTGLPHSAPLGMSFGNIGNFPPSFQADLFVAYHGSWNVQNSANIRDCKVERVVVENGQPVRSETFVSGWRAAGYTCGSPSTYGRPVDVIFGPDGAMYISDDAGGRVYRLIYAY